MMLKAGETMRRLEEAVTEARAFFGIDPLYILTISATLDGSRSAQIDAGDGYLRNTIAVNLDYYQTRRDVIRRDMAHEVAHLVSNELVQIQRRMPPEWRGPDGLPGALLNDALETLTSRLERLFLRERPEPPQ